MPDDDPMIAYLAVQSSRHEASGCPFPEESKKRILRLAKKQMQDRCVPPAPTTRQPTFELPRFLT